MALLEYLERKLHPIEFEHARKLYNEDMDIFMETLERFRKHFMEELKVMREDITSINGIGYDQD